MAAATSPAQHERHGTVVIYSPYINKHKTIQEVDCLCFVLKKSFAT
jgi:hypothetical protein